MKPSGERMGDVDANRRRRNRGAARGRVALSLLVALITWLVSGSALAVDIWTAPNPGVRHLHRSTPAPAEFHALVVDLSVPGVAIRCSPSRERWKSTSAYARDAHLAAAINGGFWGLFGQGAQGLAAGGGAIWSSDDEELGFFAFGRDGRAWISRPSDVVEAGRRGVTDAVSGRPLIVDRGRLSDELAAFPRTYTREPRTAAGVSQDGHTVYLVTVDGRRSTSHGGTLVEMAELLVELGAYRGINLDGGGSTTMYVANEGGVVNRPSRGWEREVVNHIGVVAPAPPPAAASAAPPVADVRETPRDVVQRALQTRSAHANESEEDSSGRGRFSRFMIIDRLGLGRSREIIVPALFVLAFLVLGGTAWYVIRRLARRRSASKPAQD
ncbi:MAG: phosphodiester glycosidase family protein [Deltaproteobacteria bacterium]